ncbi:MAG: hypothetical protein IPH33_13705 [Bacteroidetes bacterium]|nr:hypothetical protein [Bacteroidota bacterium]
MCLRKFELRKVKAKLEAEGWVFGDKSEDKILIIANSRVAERAGFSNLYRVYTTRFGEGAKRGTYKKRKSICIIFSLAHLTKTSKERESGVEHLIAFIYLKTIIVS